MATRIAQRLIAAGASPERAAAFERQFAAARPGIRPRELQDAFDEELAALSRSVYPGTFRPPTLDDPQIDDYINAVYGKDRYDNAKRQVAPNYFAAEQSWEQQNDPEQFTFEENYPVFNKFIINDKEV